MRCFPLTCINFAVGIPKTVTEVMPGRDKVLRNHETEL